MNTPAHVIFSLGIPGWRNASGYAIAIALGAMVLFFPHHFKLTALRTTILATSVIYSGFFIFMVAIWMQKL